MMKTIKITQFFAAISALVILAGCVNDDDFSIPDLTVQEPQINGEVITITALSNLYAQAVAGEADDLGIDPNDEDAIADLRGSFRLELGDTTQYIVGFVISSDEAGNWFEELIIQDSAVNPTSGVRFLIDEAPLFTFYEVGRKVFIKLENLFVGDSNGVLSLGFTDNLDKVPAPLQFDYVQRSPIVETIVPVETTIADFNDNLENIFIELTDVQFIKDQVINQSLSFAGEPLDEFDGERTLISCASNQTVILSTSTFSSFKSVALPSGRGSIQGVLTRNFFGETFNLVINDPSDISFDADAQRCDPVEIDCGIAASAGPTVLFEDFFETQNTNTIISGNGWTNYQEAGTETWEAYTSGGTNASLGISARVGSFNSGDAATIAWLVTPQIDFTAQDGETLQFKTSNSFSDGSTLELLFSSDWDGNPANIPSATWDVLSAAEIVSDDDFFGDWIDSETVDLSCVESAGYIAFRYVGRGDSNFDGTYELDEIEVNAN